MNETYSAFICYRLAIDNNMDIRCTIEI